MAVHLFSCVTEMLVFPVGVTVHKVHLSRTDKCHLEMKLSCGNKNICVKTSVPSHNGASVLAHRCRNRGFRKCYTSK